MVVELLVHTTASTCANNKPFDLQNAEIETVAGGSVARHVYCVPYIVLNVLMS